MPFSLRKWYLDCVAEDGEVLVAYHAELRWRRLSLRYASVLQLDGARSTLRDCPAPLLAGERISWEAPALHISGTWDALAPAADVELIPGVRWRCLQPRSRVELRVAGRTLHGLGYAEELELTIPPWRLPIDELRWGRFAGESHGAVWIEWRGPHPLRLTLIDGVRAEAIRIAEDGVRAGGAELRLTEPRVLRSGRIGETALSIIPDLQKLFPGRIVGLEETKWRARGTLEGPGAEVGQGWAIHEVVRWPK